MVGFLLRGGLEAVLAGLLAAVALTFGARMGNPWTISADLTMCVAAAATGRWPRAASIVVVLALAPYFAFPPQWVTFGEYGPLIPILGCSIRGLRRERNWVSAAVLLVLTALQVHDYPGPGYLYIFGGLVWVAIIAALWLIGAGFAAARSAALAEQRLILARDLHDTVARTVARVSLSASQAKQSGSIDEMSQAIEGVHQIGAELRWMMALLREPDTATDSNRTPGSVSGLTAQVQRVLSAQGIPVTVAAEGNDRAIPGDLVLIISKCLGEASANVERHGKPGHPCALLATVTDQSLDLVLINECNNDESPSGRIGLGLTGCREILTAVNGQITTKREGTQWILQMKVPLDGGYE